MIRTLSMLVRRPDITREQFHAHYEDTHAPLALPMMKGLVHYVRNHIVDTLGGEDPFFDTLSEFGYESLDVLDDNIDMLYSERGAELRADELTFMDKPRNHFFSVRTSRELPCKGEPLDGAVKIVLLATREDPDRPAFHRAYAESLTPVLANATSWWHWESRAFGDTPPHADVATLAWFAPGALDEAAVRSWAPPSPRTYRLRVDERATCRAEP